MRIVSTGEGRSRQALKLSVPRQRSQRESWRAGAAAAPQRTDGLCRRVLRIARASACAKTSAGPAGVDASFAS